MVQNYQLKQNLEYVLNSSVLLISNIVLHDFVSPCGNPTLIYSDSGKWVVYYLYEDETIVIGSEKPIKMDKLLHMNNFLRLSIENEKVFLNETDNSEFVREIITHYTRTKSNEDR
jgi:hypothetical protein